MRKVILSLLTITLIGQAYAQTIVFQEDFQSEEPIAFQFLPEDADDEEWINYDQDTEPPAGGTNLDPANDDQGFQAFFYSLEFGAEGLENPDNVVIASNSWHDDFTVASDNWLITPQIEISNAQHVLQFNAAPSQAPRYCDGFRVLVSPEGEPFVEEFELVYQAGEMTALSDDGYGFNPDDFSWNLPFGSGTDGTTGYRPGNNFELGNPFLVEDTQAAGDMYAMLPEPVELDLSAYDGQTIRIAFHHNSEDDFLMSFDDITVVDNSTIGLEEMDFDLLVNLFPNPVDYVMNLDFSERIQSEARVTIFDVRGAVVFSQEYLENDLRVRQNMDLSDLSSGLYSIQVIVDNASVVSKNFVKR